MLPPEKWAAIGYKIAVYLLTLLDASIRAMRETLCSLKDGEVPERLLPFEELKAVVEISSSGSAFRCFSIFGG